MKNLDLFKIAIVIILSWIAFSLHKLSERDDSNGRFIPRDRGVVDTRTGEYYTYGTLKSGGNLGSVKLRTEKILK